MAHHVILSLRLRSMKTLPLIDPPNGLAGFLNILTLPVDNNAHIP